jgi:hypothetical protein
MDLTKLTKDQLRNLVENARRKSRQDIATEALQELTRRGGGRSSDYAMLRWNQEAVRQALAPFVEVSRAVPDNKRTAYTEAGGMKIGRRRDDPEWMWVDSYTAIKTPKINAVLVGYVPRPGDDAFFRLMIDQEVVARFEPEDLPDALERWQAVAQEAAG